MQINRTLPLLSLFLVSGCWSTGFREYPAGTSGDVLLAPPTPQQGGEGSVQYILRPSGWDDPVIHEVRTQHPEVADLGLTVRSIDTPFAAERGLEAWEGVYLKSVAPERAASAAGLARGDVLLTLNGVELSNAEQLEELVELGLVPGQEVMVSVATRVDDGAWEERAVPLTVGSRRISESSTQLFPLDAENGVMQRTGLQVATIGPDLARPIWGIDGEVALITTVVSGSPGYDAGFRGGDRIRTCNGAPVDSAAVIADIVRSGTKRLDLVVEGMLGPHSSSVDVVKDVDEKSSFHIPILVDHTSTVDRTRTSFLDFIFQFGFNHRRTAYTSDTREPNVTSRLSILPLGMFTFERTPTRARNTIFWFISWSTSR